MNEINKTDRKHILWCMCIVLVVFLFSLLLGYYVAIAYPEFAREIVKAVRKEKFGTILNNNPAPWFIFAKIFVNNAFASFLALFLGILLGIAPVVIMSINGYTIGMTVSVALLSDVSPQQIIIALLPHGIFELSAFLMSAGYGLWLGYRFYRFLRYHDSFRIYLKHALMKYIKIIMPLLFVAALIEAFITPFVIELSR